MCGLLSRCTGLNDPMPPKQVEVRENGRVRQLLRSVPPWLIGLLIAQAIFLIGYFVFRALGFGDDPVIGEAAGLLISAMT